MSPRDGTEGAPGTPVSLRHSRVWWAWSWYPLSTAHPARSASAPWCRSTEAWRRATKPWNRRMRCSSLGSTPAAARHRRRSWRSEIDSSAGSAAGRPPRHGMRVRTASSTSGSGSPAVRATNDCSRASATCGVGASPRRSVRRCRSRQRSVPATSWSTSSSAGRRTSPPSTPGRSRTPTTVPPTGMSWNVARVRGPSTRGSSPSRHSTEAPPCGTCRCARGRSPTSWIHTDDASAVSLDVGTRST